MWLLAWSIQRVLASRRTKAYQRLPTTQHAYGIGTSDDEETDDDFAEHLSLRHTLNRAGHEIKLDRPRTERLSVFVEFVCVVGIITTCLPCVREPDHVWISIAAAVPWVSHRSFLERPEISDITVDIHSQFSDTATSILEGMQT